MPAESHHGQGPAIDQHICPVGLPLDFFWRRGSAREMHSTHAMLAGNNESGAGMVCLHDDSLRDAAVSGSVRPMIYPSTHIEHLCRSLGYCLAATAQPCAIVLTARLQNTAHADMLRTADLCCCC